MRTTGVDAGAPAVFGLVDRSATTVTIEAPGQSPIAAELYAVDGWHYQAFVAFLPADLGDQAQVVARLVDGTEVGRQPLGASTDPEAADTGDCTEECVTNADGTTETECSASSAGAAVHDTIPGSNDPGL